MYRIRCGGKWHSIRHYQQYVTTNTISSCCDQWHLSIRLCDYCCSKDIEMEILFDRQRRTFHSCEDTSDSQSVVSERRLRVHHSKVKWNRWVLSITTQSLRTQNDMERHSIQWFFQRITYTRSLQSLVRSIQHRYGTFKRRIWWDLWTTRISQWR